MTVWVWLSLIVGSVVVEFLTFSLVSVWVTAGAVAGLILALFKVNVYIQITVAFVVTVLCLLFLRKYFLSKLKRTSLIEDRLNISDNEVFVLINAITKESAGTLKMHGVIWEAFSENGEEIPSNSKVVIVNIKGNKLFVKAI